MRLSLTGDLAAAFVDIALKHVSREYPGKLDHVLSGPSDVQNPRALHPAFYGSFDWHSCVHGFWLLAKVLQLYPELPQAAHIRALFDEHLSAEKIAAELDYFQRPVNRSSERPYGWAWLLMLASELTRHATSDAERWRTHLEPLAQFFAGEFNRYLSKLPYPIRAGTHTNTAFAAALGIEYAQLCGDRDLLAAVSARIRHFFGADTDCQALEPGGNDFLSPLLIELECMRRVCAPAGFLEWAGRFLPRLGTREPSPLFEPVAVPDRTDGQIAHLDGLNFSRAWCWRLFAKALADGDPRRDIALAAADAHIAASLPHITADYMGEHWLATFAVLALTA